MLAVHSMAFSQTMEFRLGMFQGANKIFLEAGLRDTRVGHASAVGATFKFRGRKARISFEPSLLIEKNVYCSRLNDDVFIKVKQRGLTIMPTAGLLVSEHVTLKAGFFVESIFLSDLGVEYKKNSSYYQFSNPDLYRTYSPNTLQAGVMAGLSVALGEKKRVAFSIVLQQFAVPFLSSDYTLTLATPTQNKPVFNNRSKASIVMAGLEIKITKKPRPVKTEEQE